MSTITKPAVMNKESVYTVSQVKVFFDAHSQFALDMDSVYNDSVDKYDIAINIYNNAITSGQPVVAIRAADATMKYMEAKFDRACAECMIANAEFLQIAKFYNEFKVSGVMPAMPKDGTIEIECDIIF